MIFGGQVGGWPREFVRAALGSTFSWPGRSSKHMAFDWSGPDEG
jgi:hypothetical protein